MLQTTNYLELTFWAKSQNESFARSAVGAFFSQLNPTLEELDDLKTAVSEAVTNCIVHAYNSQQKGEIVVCCQLHPNAITVQIVDFGKGIENVEQAIQPFYSTCTTGDRSGMGFTVMQAFCDDVKVESGDGQTKVTLHKTISLEN
ncbi:MAG: anti-sigma F factor [Clostridia bacterium]|nr:anti-sigma F factor [Clostridia bacterium]